LYGQNNHLTEKIVTKKIRMTMCSIMKSAIFRFQTMSKFLFHAIIFQAMHSHLFWHVNLMKKVILHLPTIGAAVDFILHSTSIRFWCILSKKSFLTRRSFEPSTILIHFWHKNTKPHPSVHGYMNETFCLAVVKFTMSYFECFRENCLSQIRSWSRFVLTKAKILMNNTWLY
jgi:hypothetical protein